jgi:transcriptional regulator with XRE-family HTH domain
MSTALATYMHRRGISDADLAALTGRDRSMINKIKRGMLKPTLELAGRIESVTDGAVPMQSWVDTPVKEAGDTVALCSRCGERAEASQIISCTSVHCPMRAQEAA